MAKERYVSLKDAATRLGLKRPSLYRYIHTLKLETKHFTLDREAYLKKSDFEKIQVIRQEKAQRHEIHNGEGANT